MKEKYKKPTKKLGLLVLCMSLLSLAGCITILCRLFVQKNSFFHSFTMSLLMAIVMALLFVYFMYNALMLLLETHNRRYFNRVFYIQKYHCVFSNQYFLRFWILGFYFDTEKEDHL